jgi:hypothetical protein
LIDEVTGDKVATLYNINERHESGRLDNIRLPIAWHTANKLALKNVFQHCATQISAALTSSSIIYNGRGIDVSGTSLA